MSNDIKFDFFHNDTDHPMVREYFKIRDAAYKEQWDLKHFCGGEDSYDYDSHILIASLNGEVIGGARFCVSGKGEKPLPMETEDFTISKLYKDIDVFSCKYAEISRFAIKSGFRQGDISQMFYDHLLRKKSPELDLKYVFCVTSMGIARSYRMLCKKIGINIDIERDIKVPDLKTYENLKMYVAKADLNHLSQEKQDAVINQMA